MLLSDDTLPLPDPAGGEFTHCGDIDRLLPLATELPLDRGFELEVLGLAEAFEDIYFTPDDMPALVRDVMPSEHWPDRGRKYTASTACV